MASGAPREGYEGWRTAALGAVAFLVLVPVTLPVSVLRAFVLDRFGVSEVATSLFMSINMVGAALAAPVAGALADRFGRRRELLVGGLALDAVLLYALTLPMPFPWFMALRFVEGGAHITALSLLLALASASQRDERRGRAMGMVGAGLTLGVAVGAMAGGLLGRTDPLRPLQVGACVAAAGSVLAWLLLVETQRGERERPGAAAIAALLRRHPMLLAPLAFSFVDRFTVGFYTTTFSLYLSGVHGLSARHIGILIFVFMLPFAILSYPFGRLSERRSPVAFVCLGSLVYGVGTAFVAHVPVPLLPGLMVALGVASAVMFVPSLVLTTRIAPEAIRGTALGAFNAFGSLGFIIGPLVGGLVSESVAAVSDWTAGYRTAFAVAGASQILCVAATLPFLLRGLRRGLVR
jgi:MFS family permease